MICQDQAFLSFSAEAGQGEALGVPRPEARGIRRQGAQCKGTAESGESHPEAETHLRK